MLVFLGIRAECNAAVKFLLFLYSYSLRKKSSQVQVLWQDHRNDLWINGFGEIPPTCAFMSYAHIFTGILMSAGGSKLKWCSLFPILHCDNFPNIISRPRPDWSHHRMLIRFILPILFVNENFYDRLHWVSSSRGHARYTQNSSSLLGNRHRTISCSCSSTKQRHLATTLSRLTQSGRIMCVTFHATFEMLY